MPLLPFALILLVLSGLTDASATLHIPLSRRGGSPNIEYYASEIALTRVKYGYTGPHSSSHKRAPPEDLPIINQEQDLSYLGTVLIGTPPQSFQVVLDTGSTDLLVSSPTCSTCALEAPAYRASRSSTHQALNLRTTVSFGSGDVTGTISRDVVRMGGFTRENQTFLVAEEIEPAFLKGPVSGIFGLAWPAISGIRSVPFWLNLANSSQLESPEFSFWMTRFNNDSMARDAEHGGVFTLGGRNSTLYQGDVEFLTMPGSALRWWLLPLESLAVDGSPVPITTGINALAAIDTGTTLIGGPAIDVARFWSAVPGARRATFQEGLWLYPCSTQLNVTISFGGRSWPISPDDMNLGAVDLVIGQTCAGAIFELDTVSNAPGRGVGIPTWIVGATFLKNVYSIFSAEPPSIGFAELSAYASGFGNIVAGGRTVTVTSPGPRNTNTGQTANSSTPTAGLSILLAIVFTLLPAYTSM